MASVLLCEFILVPFNERNMLALQDEEFEINYWYVVIGQCILGHNEEYIKSKDLPLKNKIKLLVKKIRSSKFNKKKLRKSSI